MNPIACYFPVEVGWPYGIRGTLQQTNNGVAWLNPPTSRTGTTVNDRIRGMALGSFVIHNRAAASTYCFGIGVRIPNEFWKFYTRVDSTTTSTDVTTSAQGTSTAVDLNSTTNSDGHVILSRVPFNAISYNISQVVTGSPVNAIRYTNTAGSGWTNFGTNNYALPASSAATQPGSTGEMAIAFNAPSDWGKTQASGLETGLPGGYYGVNLRSTTAPSQKAQATGIEIFRLYFLKEAVADNATMDYDFGAKDFAMAWDATEGWVGDALVMASLDPAANTMGVAVNLGTRLSAQVRAL